jgi:hypothetical protein
MSEKTLHNLIIFVLLVAVVLLSLVASKSEHFGAASTSPAAQQMSAQQMSAHLRRGQGGAVGLLSGHLRSGQGGAIGLLSGHLRSGSPITGGQSGAGGLKAQIQNGGTKTLPSLEHFRGVGVGAGQSMLSARLREASSAATPSMASDMTGHDNKATNMAIVPPMSKMTIMSNLTTK